MLVCGRVLAWVGVRRRLERAARRRAGRLVEVEAASPSVVDGMLVVRELVLANRGLEVLGWG